MHLQRAAFVASVTWLGFVVVTALLTSWLPPLLEAPALFVGLAAPLLALASFHRSSTGPVYWAASLSNLLLSLAGIVLLGFAFSGERAELPAVLLVFLGAVAVPGLNALALLLRRSVAV